MQPTAIERRSGIERRRRSLRGYWLGSLNPRRRNGRRAMDSLYPIIDWHSPRVLALALSILLLCVGDGVLTIVLLSHGAIEVNPFMAKLLPHSIGWFAAVKLALTGIGIVVLAACSRMRLFRAVPVEMLLSLILCAYIVLVSYELRLVERIH